jgi:glycosyltransferase involved in cell wall biosynthesis
MTLHVNLTVGSIESALRVHPDRRRPGDEVLDYSGTLVHEDPTPKRTLLRAIRRSAAVDFYVDDLPTAQLGRLSFLKLFGVLKPMTVLDLESRTRPLLVREVVLEITKTTIFFFLTLPWRRFRETRALARTLRTLAKARAVPPRRERPRRVAYLRTDLIATLKAGGSAAHISGVANALASQGIEVKLWSTAVIPTVKPPQTLVPFTTNGPDLLPGRQYFVEGRRFVEKVAPELRAFAPDLIYWRHSRGGLAGAVLSQRLGVPLVLEYNGSEVRADELWGKSHPDAPKDPHRALLRHAEDLSFQLAARIVTVSSVLKDELVAAGVPAAKVQVEPNGVDLDRFPREALDQERARVREKLGFKPEHVVCGFIGTFGKWHGAQVLAQAVKPSCDKLPELRFLMIGDGAFMPEVRATLARDGVADKVVLTGLVPQAEAPALLNACDFHASPHVPNEDGSQFFGSPTKLFEYMALGRGIVASSLNQIGEVLRQDETAILVPPGELPPLIEGIVALARDPARRERLGRAALAEVKAHFTWEANVQGLLASLEVAARSPELAPPIALPVVRY